jgi:hypothetical protein
VSWKVALPGKGSSTPIVVNQHIYLSTPDKGQDAILALDFHGKQLWLTRLGVSAPRSRLCSTALLGSLAPSADAVPADVVCQAIGFSISLKPCR